MWSKFTRKKKGFGIESKIFIFYRNQFWNFSKEEFGTTKKKEFYKSLKNEFEI